MKILVIFTGGTIGSSVNSHSGYIAPDSSNNYLLLDLYKKKYSEAAEFDTLQGYSILSENLNGAYLTKLCDIVTGQLQNNYDGIIVTHGSDTLQYSAAALKFACGNVTIPVVLVCSNYVLTDSRANGLLNFAAAVQFIREKSGAGVFVTYANDSDEVMVHSGEKLLAYHAFSDKLYSVKGNYFGKFICRGNELEYKKNPAYLPLEMPGNFSHKFTDNEVRFVMSCPGIDWKNILSGNPRAVLIQGYHSGTLPTDNTDFREFALSAKENKIPVFLCGSSKEAAYESVAAFDELGITIIEDMAPAAAYVWVWGCR